MIYNSGVARKPAIFVSSTCYDLKQIRQNIRTFIEDNLGYEAILSEYDSFPINPDMDTVNNCLRVVEERADIFVLVIGGRYGYVTDRGEKSITNLEYLRAKTKGIPIYAFIDKSILNTLPIWESNPDADFSKIVDSPKLFEFVQKVRSQDSVWTHEFDNANEIVTCLQKQLAYLFNDSLHIRKHLNKSKVSPKILQYSGKVFELAVEKPDAWEYLLFAEALKDNLAKLDDLRYDLKYGISFRNIICLHDLSEIISWAQLKFNELMNRVHYLNVIMNKAIQEAMGKPGEAGDADHIIYVAEKCIDVYKSIHEWTLDFKCVIVPDVYNDLLTYAAQASSTVIEDIELFINDYNTKIWGAFLGEQEESDEKKQINCVLNLRVPNIGEFNKELDKIQKGLW